MRGGKKPYIILESPGSPTSEKKVETASVAELEELARALFDRSRRELIAEAAYYRSLDREPGECGPERDWLEAEAEIDAFLLARKPL